MQKAYTIMMLMPIRSLGKRNSLKRGCPKSNDCCTKCGGFDKVNHRNATLLDSLFHFYNLFSALSNVLNMSIAIVIGPTPPGTGVMKLAVSRRSA